MIKVVYENIDNYSRTINQNKERILVEIDNLMSANEELKTVWKGYDADAFTSNMENYLNKMKNIPASMERISNFVTMSEAQYKDEDDLYANDLKKEQLRYKV